MPTPPAVTTRHVLRLAQASLALQVALVASGGAVRVTGSGLGCPTWPTCTNGSLPTTSALGVHGLIEFSNRLLAVVLFAVGVLLVLAVHRVPHPRTWSRLAYVQALVVPAQAVLGGVLVLSHLNPYVLQLHLLVSFPLIYASALLLHQVQGRAPLAVPFPVLRWGLLASSALVLAAGTFVTGTGPHAGGPKVHRLPFTPRDVAQLHADAVYLLVGLTLATLVVAWATPQRRWLVALVGLIVAQAGLGYWQYYTGVPASLVELHVTLAAVVFTVASWVQVSAAPRADAPQQRTAQPIPVPAAGTATAR